MVKSSTPLKEAQILTDNWRQLRNTNSAGDLLGRDSNGAGGSNRGRPSELCSDNPQFFARISADMSEVLVIEW